MSNFDLCISTASGMELLVGAPNLAAKSSGMIDSLATQETLARLVAPLETLRLFIRVAEEYPDVKVASNFIPPRSLYCHLGLNQAFEHLSTMMHTAADLMGGTTVTGQSTEDLAHPTLGPRLNQFFSRPG